MKICLLSATLLSFVASSYARPNGAPLSACSSLMPRHGGIKPQASLSPYTISAVDIGNKIQVTISSPVGEEFEGFVIQARSSSDMLIDGEFTTTQIAKAIDCLGGKRNTLTHINPTPKTEVKTEWTPKETVNDVVFRVTVLKTFAIFWTDIRSSPVKMSSNEPTFPTEQDSKIHSQYDGCFDIKGCIGLPSECIKTAECKVLLTYSKSPDGIKFSMYGFLDSEKYMAMALSDDNQMGDDSVTECIRDGNEVVVRVSHNEGKSNSHTAEVPKGLYNSSFNDGLSSCSWTTNYFSRFKDHNYNLAAKKYYVLLAMGSVQSGTLQYHYEMKSSTPEAVNFTAYGPDKGQETPETTFLDTSPEMETKSTSVISGHETAETTFLPTSTVMKTKSTSAISPVALNETLNSGGSQCCLNFLLLAILGLFYATRGHLYYVCFGKL